MIQPRLQALLIADHVYVDAATGKKVVAGIFHRMFFVSPKVNQEVIEEAGKVRLKIPPGGHRAGSPFCYISLTEVRTKEHFVLRYINLENDQALFQAEFDVEHHNPLDTIEVVLPLPLLPAEKEGHFALELLWNDVHLGSHRINVDVVSTDGE